MYARGTTGTVTCSLFKTGCEGANTDVKLDTWTGPPLGLILLNGVGGPPDFCGSHNVELRCSCDFPTEFFNLFMDNLQVNQLYGASGQLIFPPPTP
jgi:hypothetical protein